MNDLADLAETRAIEEFDVEEVHPIAPPAVIAPPAMLPPGWSFFVDAADGVLKVRSPSGNITTIAL